MTPTAASYSTSLSSDTSSGTGLSVKLRSHGVTINNFGILHGPAIVSDSSVELHPGDSVSFEWRASGGSDAYDVIGYLVDEIPAISRRFLTRQAQMLTPLLLGQR